MGRLEPTSHKLFNTMKKIHLLLLCLTICLFSACHDKLWDAIDDLDVRVARLEELCKEMNTNITSIQTIVNVFQSNDVITSIVEIEKDGEVIGYTITFAGHDPITIYHGQDGKDGQNGTNGQDGQDGITPVIGVAQDTDGVYYWTLNGEWLLDDNGNKLPVSGKDGQNGTNGSNGQDGADGKDGQDGEDGKDGVDGQDGKDGITPQLKIEDGYWYISYDNGATWTQLGKATGEDGKDGQNGADGKDGQDGAEGKDGQDGDSMFQSVTQDENYVYFTLADGTVIKIAKSNGDKNQPDGDDIIKFEDFNLLTALLNAGIDINTDGYISYNEVALTDTLVLSGNTSIVLFREFQHFTNIKYFAFSGCSSLYHIELPTNIKNISDGAFRGCNKLATLNIPESCTKIGANAFNSCSSLLEISLPSQIKRIESGTFQSCSSLKSLNIPNSVNYIGSGALNKLTLDTLILPEEYSADALGQLYNDNLTTIIWNSISYPTEFRNSYPEYGLGAYYSHQYGSGERNPTITTIIFGEKVESLPKNLCNHMTALTTIYSKNPTPPTLNSSFVYCYNIQNVYVPKESIEQYKISWSLFADKIIGYDFE